jgi:hypothetical protein
MFQAIKNKKEKGIILNKNSEIKRTSKNYHEIWFKQKGFK